MCPALPNVRLLTHVVGLFMAVSPVLPSCRHLETPTPSGVMTHGAPPTVAATTSIIDISGTPDRRLDTSHPCVDIVDVKASQTTDFVRL